MHDPAARGGEGGVTSTVQIFNPTTKTWTYPGSLPWASRYLQAALLPNGRVLAAGGQGVNGASALYNPTSGQWTSTAPMTTDRAHHSLTTLASGSVLAAGGCGGYYCQTVYATAETYDPSTGTWSPTRTVSSTRQDHTAVRLSSGRVEVQGGTDDNLAPVDTPQYYDPTTRTWTLT